MQGPQPAGWYYDATGRWGYWDPQHGWAYPEQGPPSAAGPGRFAQPGQPHATTPPQHRPAPQPQAAPPPSRPQAGWSTSAPGAGQPSSQPIPAHLTPAGGPAQALGRQVGALKRPARIAAGALAVLVLLAMVFSTSEEPDTQPVAATAAAPAPPAERLEDATTAGPAGDLQPQDAPAPPVPAATATAPAVAAPAPASGLARLALPREPLNVRAFNDVEENLAAQLVAQLESTDWWVYAHDLQVEEDMFISDIRLELSLLYHHDAVDIAVRACNDVLAAIPPSSSSLMVHLRLQQALGGGTEIDGSAEGWTFYPETVADGATYQDVPGCDARPIRDRIVEDTEEYLGGQ